jgi:hypothetical protein
MVITYIYGHNGGIIEPILLFVNGVRYEAVGKRYKICFLSL